MNTTLLQRLVCFIGLMFCLFCLRCASTGEITRGKTETPVVVFVCEHGSVKSLIASEFFKRMAEEKGLRVLAVARGMTPDAEVPAKIADQLNRDGFDVSGFRPEKLQPGDLQHALRAIAIGVDIPGDSKSVAHWDDIPPASLDYPAARDRLISRIETLILELQAREPTPRK